ncbi:MAG: T9SS type A sorting domain-containing protein [Candidatus Marinimicrobia bacterium]|nr:T9SS type A sorting domain-containing protein [Candidatus Neomarinimicrobiota bacterium]
MNNCYRWNLSVLTLAIAICSLIANPIAPKFISEIQLANILSDDWTIELRIETYMDSTLDGWYITSASDTAFFRPWIQTRDEGFILITKDSLQSAFTLKTSGDIITLYNSSAYWMDEVRYGDVSNSEISAPLPGQSICSRLEHPYGWYIDASPTLGEENDLSDASGTVAGVVHNINGEPVSNALVIYDKNLFEPDTVFIVPENDGHYTFQRVSDLGWIRVQAESYTNKDTLVQVWPDSILQLDIQLTPESTEGIYQYEGDHIPDQFGLSQNYPNPFNPVTRIEINLAETAMTSLRILKLDGKEVSRLINQQLSAGTYSIFWDASRVPSGIYLYSITAGKFTMTRKLLVLK